MNYDLNLYIGWNATDRNNNSGTIQRNPNNYTTYPFILQFPNGSYNTLSKEGKFHVGGVSYNDLYEVSTDDTVIRFPWGDLYKKMEFSAGYLSHCDCCGYEIGTVYALDDGSFIFSEEELGEFEVATEVTEEEADLIIDALHSYQVYLITESEK